MKDWGDISKEEFNGYKEVYFKVEFDGNNLNVTIGEKSMSFSTDKKDVTKPSSSTPPIQSGPAFANGRPVDATYVARQTLILENGKFSSTYNIAFEYDTEEPFQGTYTQSGNTITLKLDSPMVWGSEVTKATATISGDTLTLTIDFKESDGETYTEKTVFKKRSNIEWEHSEKVELSSDRSIKYYENDELCWKGKYTIIDDETAAVNVEQIHIKGSFGTADGNLLIEDANQDFLSLDLHDFDEDGGVAMPFAREK